MLVTNVTLYKTPLDNSYDNVFDIEYFNTEIPDNTEYKSIYAQAIEQMYGADKIEVTLPIYIKSLKLEDNQTIITLPYNQLDIRDYNYIKIDDKWFFITNTVSENDSVTETTPPSVTLYLEWDTWANNIDKLMNNKNNIIGNSQISHKNRFTNNNIIFYNNGNNNKYETVKVDISQPNRVLFAKITLDPSILQREGGLKIKTPSISVTNIDARRPDGDKINETLLTVDSIGVIKDNLIDNQILTNNRLIIYTPMALINNKEILEYKFTSSEIPLHYINKIYTTGIYGIVSADFIMSIGYKDFPIQKLIDYTFDGSDMSYVQTIELTYNAPIDYTINNYIVNFNTQLLELNIDIGVPVYFPCSIKQLSLLLTATEGDIQTSIGSNNLIPQNSSILAQYYNFIEEININYIDIFDISKPNTNVYAPNDKNKDPKLQIYPYKYIECIYGLNSCVLSPKFFNDKYFTIVINKETNQPRLSIKSNNGYIENIRELYIEGNGTVQYTIRQLDNYLIRNGNQKNTNMLFKELSNSVGLLSSMFSVIGGDKSQIPNMIESGINVVKVPATQKMFENDLKNTPNIVNNSDYSEDDLYYQDRVILIKHETGDIQAKDSFANELYVYGYTIDYVTTILFNSRFWFDYCKTNGVYIDLPMNTIDKKTIERIFNKGVFKYHINVTPNGLIVDSNLSKNGSLNNIERSIATL